MAVTLEGIALPDVVFEDEYGITVVDSVVEKALDGTPLIWEQVLPSRVFDLVGGPEFAWITRSVLDSLKVLAMVPSAVYTLSYEGVSYSVRFRNEDPPVISAEPLLARPNQSGTDYYSKLRIKLMEVAT